jgi:hypothetical protein
VGRAPNGWDDDSTRTQPKKLLKAAVMNTEDLSLLNRITEDYVENNLIPDYGGYGVVRKSIKETQRKLWPMIYRLTPYILDINNNPQLGERPKFNKENSERCFHSIAWTNLLKICMSEGYGFGNPDPDMENFLLKYFPQFYIRTNYRRY